jgi:hypothetical protein
MAFFRSYAYASGMIGGARRMIRLAVCAVSLAAFLMPSAMTTPAQAADLWRGTHVPVIYAQPVVYGLPEPLCYWCIRDAIYADTKLIAHLEADPDVDEADKAPWILGARADVRHLRRILGPVETVSVAPCCYWRKKLYVR